jgi:hypothetical protein
MYRVFESEILHRGEDLAERIGNLCHRRYLPVEVPALDVYDEGIHDGLFLGIDVYIDSLVIEPEFATVEPEVLCCVDKPQETWDGKPELVKELDLELLEARGGDPMNKCFQVSANTAEPEMVKVGECDGCYDRRICELPLY